MKSLKSFGKPKRPRRRPGSVRGSVLVRRVVGDSMLPNLKSGRLVVGWAWFGRLSVGDVVIFRHGGLEKIKRVGDIRDGQLFLIGDNHEQSLDGRSFGWLPKTVVRAKVVWPRQKKRRV